MTPEPREDIWVVVYSTHARRPQHPCKAVGFKDVYQDTARTPGNFKSVDYCGSQVSWWTQIRCEGLLIWTTKVRLSSNTLEKRCRRSGVKQSSLGRISQSLHEIWSWVKLYHSNSQIEVATFNNQKQFAHWVACPAVDQLEVLRYEISTIDNWPVMSVSVYEVHMNCFAAIELRFIAVRAGTERGRVL